MNRLWRAALALGLIMALTTLVASATAGSSFDHRTGSRRAAGAIAQGRQGQLPEVATTIFFPIVSNRPITPPYDMAQLMSGDWRLYEVQHSSGSQARHQTQTDGVFFFHVKGDELNAEWEELWYTEEAVYRGTDTSPGNAQYYTLRDPGLYGSAWAPRYWNVGELYERNPVVTFYRKSDCGAVLTGSQQSWLLFEAYYPSYTFPNGITLNNVVQLAWLLEPNGAPLERYYYALFYGLVGWWSSTNQQSYISEIHPPGARPNSKREVIGCLDRSPLNQQAGPVAPLPYWPGDHRR